MMGVDNWDDLRFLLAVAKAGSMTGAARLLGTNVATVSRRLDRLAGSLGVEAFARTPEGWRPSDAALRLIDAAMAFEGRLAAEVNALEGKRGPERARIRLGALSSVIHGVLLPALSPDGGRLSRVDLTVAYRAQGEGLGEHDLVIRLGPPEGGRLRTRKVGSTVVRLYGTTEPEGSDWIGLTDGYDDLPHHRMGLERFGRPPVLRFQSFNAVREAMLRTGLPAPLPETLARQSAPLRPLVSDRPETVWVQEFWVAYHESRRSDPALQAVLGWIEDAFAAQARR